MISLQVRRLRQDDKKVEGIMGLGLVTSKGRIEIRPGHESYCAVLLPPCVTYQDADLQWHTIPFSEEGFLRFDKDQCQLWVS